jgi:hypothetical protein|nr:MAG TPA: hypothetical protein [Caudoviricetes sp.]
MVRNVRKEDIEKVDVEYIKGKNTSIKNPMVPSVERIIKSFSLVQ